MILLILFHLKNESPFRTDLSKRQILWKKKSGFVDSGFVKKCNELVIGYNIGRNITNDNKNAFSDHIKKCPGDKPYCKVSTFGKKVARIIS